MKMEIQDVYQLLQLEHNAAREIELEAEKLLQNVLGNNGRALRRFLLRNTQNRHVHQSFLVNVEVENDVFAIVEDEAKDAHERNFWMMEDEPEMLTAVLGTIAENGLSVQNSYVLAHNPLGASVAQMRTAVDFVGRLGYVKRTAIANIHYRLVELQCELQRAQNVPKKKQELELA